eukprot:589831-Hanusia_phi.AAC.1
MDRLLQRHNASVLSDCRGSRCCACIHSFRVLMVPPRTRLGTISSLSCSCPGIPTTVWNGMLCHVSGFPVIGSGNILQLEYAYAAGLFTRTTTECLLALSSACAAAFQFIFRYAYMSSYADGRSMNMCSPMLSEDPKTNEIFATELMADASDGQRKKKSSSRRGGSREDKERDSEADV